mgnify:CR=1 FL=1
MQATVTVYVPETRPDTVVVWEVIVIPKVPVLTVTFAVSKDQTYLSIAVTRKWRR